MATICSGCRTVCLLFGRTDCTPSAVLCLRHPSGPHSFGTYFSGSTARGHRQAGRATRQLIRCGATHMPSQGCRFQEHFTAYYGQHPCVCSEQFGQRMDHLGARKGQAFSKENLFANKRLLIVSPDERRSNLTGAGGGTKRICVPRSAD